MKRDIQVQPFLDDGHEHVYTDRNPDLRLHGVRGSTERKSKESPIEIIVTHAYLMGCSIHVQHRPHPR